MPPRAGQLDQISEAIGRLEGRFEGVERYIHDNRHAVANNSQKIDGLGVQITKEIAAAEARIAASVSTAIERVEARIQTIDDRVTVLEKIKERETGARGLAMWFVQSPLIAWIFAAAVVIAAWWRGDR